MATVIAENEKSAEREKLVYERPEALVDVHTHYCPGCTHGTAHRIAAEVVSPSCTVELGGPARDPRLFQVTLDGDVIPRNTSRTSGWDYDETTNTITLYGPECARVESGSVMEVGVDFGCPGPLI